MMTSYTSAPMVSTNMLENSAKTCFVSSNMFPNRLSSLQSRSHSHLRLPKPRASIIPVTQAPNVSTTKELNVTIHRSSLLTPLIETERKSMFLSNLDQTRNYTISMQFFFTKNQHFPPETVAETLETALRKLLVPYEFLAGRLSFDQREGRLEIDCNSAGAGFVVASCESSLEELGDLVNPNPQYQKLAARELLGLQANDQPLFILQITSFKCGGIAMGMSGCHMLLDGVAYKMFLENLASVAGNKPIRIVPENDRRLLSARSPPQVTFSHPELFKLDKLQQEAPFSNKLQSKAFRLSADDIKNLKEKAKMGDEGNNRDTRVTDFNVIVAHIWRCISLAKRKINEEDDKTSSLIYSVNIRSRLRPRLPISYTGNVVYGAYCEATYTELEKGSFSHLVQIITHAEKQITEEYIRSGLDWAESNKGFRYGDIVVSSWRKLGFTDVMYPWGKPLWNSPEVRDNKNNVVILLPDIEAASGNANGAIFIVSLQAKEMKNFEDIFNRFLDKI